MSREDADVATEMQRILTGEEIEILLDAQPVNVHGLSGDEVSVTIRTGSEERTITGSDLLVATGRIPNTADIGLERTGVELDARGFIRVNERLETTASGCLGNRRMRRQPAIHACFRRRFPDSQG